MMYVLIISFLLSLSSQLCGIDPFSKITVKSIKARCAPVEASKTLLLTYTDTVVVTLADESKITTDELNVFLEKNKNSKNELEKKNDARQICQKLTFSGKIYLRRGKHEIRADQAEIDVKTTLCNLHGNIVIIQNSEKDDSKPVEVTSSHATYNFKTQELVLLGSSHNPVSTTLILNAPKNS